MTLVTFSIRTGMEPGPSGFENAWSGCNRRRQEGVGGGRGGNGVQAELAHQAILQGLPQPLDAAFGLGRVRLDVADAQVAQHAAEVGGVPRAVQFFLEDQWRSLRTRMLMRSPYTLRDRL
jgi:hypothetical protein